MRFKPIRIALLLTLAIAPCSVIHSQIKPDSVLARVGQDKILVSQFEESLKSKGYLLLGQPLSLEDKRGVLDELIETKLVNQKAANYDTKSDPDLQKAVNSFSATKLLEAVNQVLVSTQVEVSDSEAVSFYETNREIGYKEPEGVKLRQIFISFEKSDSDGKGGSSKKAEKEALSKCKEILKRLKKGADFAQLARSFSNHPSAGSGGDMGVVPRGELPAEIEEEVFSSPPGLIEKPMKSSYGYIIAEVIEHRPEHYQELTDALQEGIKKSIRDKKEWARRQVVLDSLREKTGVKYNQAALAKLGVPKATEEWIMAVGGDTLPFPVFLESVQKLALLKRVPLDSNLAMKYLESKADTLILLAAARRMKLQQKAEFKADIVKFTTELAKQKILQKKVSTRVEPTREEVRTYYEKNKDCWKEERPLYVQHIVFPDSGQAAQIRTQILAGLNFQVAALKYYPGEPEIREVAYDLGFISKSEMPRAFYNAASKLQVGEMSQPVKTDYGWHIIKLVNRMDYKPFEEVEKEMRLTLIEQKDKAVQKEWQDWLRKDVKVWVNESLLKGYNLSSASK